jgi:hypothetical protein
MLFKLPSLWTVWDSGGDTKYLIVIVLWRQMKQRKETDNGDMNDMLFKIVGEGLSNKEYLKKDLG